MRKKIVAKNYFRLVALTLIILSTIFVISVSPVSAEKQSWDYWEADFGPLMCSPPEFEIWWHFEGYFKVIKSTDDYYKDWANVECYYYTIPDQGKIITGVSISAYIWDLNAGTETYQGLFFKGIIIDSQTGDPIGDPIVDTGQIVLDFDGNVLSLSGRHDLTKDSINDQLPELLT